MIRPVSLAALALVLIGAPACASPGPDAPADGTVRWQATEARGSRLKDQVQFTLSWRRGGSSSVTSHPVALATLQGLTLEQLERGGPVAFTLHREAGDFVCEGKAEHGKGDGTCRFTEAPGLDQAFAQRGVAAPTEDQAFRLAMSETGPSLVDALKAASYQTPDVEGLIRAGNHGVDVRTVNEFAATGYRLGDVNTLVRVVDHGVDPDYIKAMAASGYKGLDAEGLVRANDHGVDPEYLREIAGFGYANLPLEQVIRLRDHGVDAEYLAGMLKAGLGGIEPEDVVRLRDHGVEPEFAREMAALGYKDLTADTLIRMSDHGVDAEDVRRANAGRTERLSADEIVRLSDRGEI